MRRQSILLAAALWLGAVPFAAAQPVLDVNAVPGLDAGGRAAYRRFLVFNLARVFMLTPLGEYAAATGATMEAARDRAMALCEKAKLKECAPYAENLDVVWHGGRPAPPTAPAPLVEDINHALVPDARYFWRGPLRAAGVYVWAHGKGPPDEDERGQQPQSHVRWFNNAGFDIVRFDRAPRADEVVRSARWLREGLRALRARGYGRVVVGGQSRGGWNALQMAQVPGLADAVIAVAPAAHGTGDRSNLSAQLDDLRGILADVPEGSARVAFVQFDDDPFAADEDARRTLLERMLRSRVPLLVIDRPPGITGHFGGASFEFSRDYGACLLRFVMTASPPGSCEGS